MNPFMALHGFQFSVFIVTCTFAGRSAGYWEELRELLSIQFLVNHNLFALIGFQINRPLKNSRTRLKISYLIIYFLAVAISC